MCNSPFFSIVIPLYNKRNKILSTIQSVQNQTFQDFEIVIVNDGSTDGSDEIVKQTNDNRIRLINQPNAGVSAARNRGIKESTGSYICFLDADDEWFPTMLEEKKSLIDQYPECDIFACSYQFINEFGDIHPMVTKHLYIAPNSEGVMSNYFKVASNSDAPLWTSIVTISKKAASNSNGFPVGITSGEDLLYWAELACKYKIAYTNKVLANYFTPTTGPSREEGPYDFLLKDDYVGKELIKLYHESYFRDLRKYISYWNKMRSSINLRLNNHKESRIYSLNALRYNILNTKALIFLFLSFLPHQISTKIFNYAK